MIKFTEECVGKKVRLLRDYPVEIGRGDIGTIVSNVRQGRSEHLIAVYVHGEGRDRERVWNIPTDELEGYNG